MKIGEALSMRARLNQQLNDLAGRIRANASVQEGDQPSENSMDLMAEYLRVSDDLARLAFKITLTNTNTDVGGRMLLELLQERETMTRQRNIYRTTADAGTPARGGFRFTRGEIKYVSMVDVAALHKMAEEMTEKIRVLDAQIQTINWQTELL